MATIKYTCTICKREIDILEKPQNITSFSKCIITNGCRGKLNKISKNQSNYRENFPSAINGVDDYIQRKVFFNHVQTLPKISWKISHNLGVLPVVEVYINTDTINNLKFEDYEVEVIDNHTIMINFTQPYAGIAQCIARSSVNNIKESAKSFTENLIKVTYSGIFVFAIPRLITKFSAPPYITPPTLPIDTRYTTNPIRIEVSVLRPNKEEIICVETIPPEILTNTAWVGWLELLLRKRRNYSIKTKSIFTFNRTLQEDTIVASTIENGTRIKFLKIDFGTGYLQPIESDDLMLLIANEPYTAIDKLKNKIIDVSHVNFSNFDYFIYKNGDLYTDITNVENTYPDIQKVS